MKLARTKEWRESHGLTQRELAAEAGVGEVTVARIETGFSVAPSTARKISKALGVTVADLLERPPVPLSEASGTGQPRAGSAADPQLTFRGNLDELEEHQVLEILEGVKTGRITVQEAARQLVGP